MKYKVGDKVKVKSLEWYNENSDTNGAVQLPGRNFVSDMARYCGNEYEITFADAEDNTYQLDETDGYWFCEEMFEDGNVIEGTVENTTFSFSDEQRYGLAIELIKRGWHGEQVAREIVALEKGLS